MLPRICWLFLIAVLALPAALQAEPYFTEDTLPPVLITPPPAVGSDAWKNDIDHIIKLQQQPDTQELKEAAAERDMSPEMITLAVDPKLTRAGFPLLYHLLDRVSDTSHSVSKGAKYYWKTKRPYIMDKRVKALIDAHDNPAYPSGHTTGSYVWAHVLGLVMPEKRAAFIARAGEIAHHRVLVGMHYPHDLDGGRQLALLIVGGLLQNKEFRQDLVQAQREIGNASF